MPGAGRAAGWAAVVALVSLAPGARAEDVTGPCAAVTDPNNAPIIDPRLDHLIVAGVHVNVLVPPGYRGGGRRYPVLYLFHGAFSDEDSFTTQTDLLAFTAQLDRDEQVIAVMPDGGHLPAGRDWVDGTHRQESFVIGTLIPYIDSHYRSLGDRGHRAAAGFSAGGMNAMVFAARHPDLFAAAASFSGFVNQIDPVGVQVVQQFADLDNQLCGASYSWLALWGDPDLHPMGWEGHDPTYLARGLEDVSLYISSGNGVPCPDNPNPDPFLVFAESVVYGMSQSLDQALTAAHVRHVAEFQSCGVHLFSNANRGLRRFWPQMFEAFGGRDPSAFELRAGEPGAAAFGWTFAADPLRAPEFLDVHDASADGVRLTGSGTEQVTTAPLFRAHQQVEVGSDAGARAVARADGAGRLTFTVDLGPAHALEQGTPAEVAAEIADPNYFVARTVRFRPLCDRDDDR